MAEVKLVDNYPFIRYEKEIYEEAEMIHRSKDFFECMSKRRSVRNFSNKSVPKEVIENIIKTAVLAPSGANRQPWTFCIVSDFSVKKIIRISAEEEERE